MSETASIDRWIARHAVFTPDKIAISFEGRDLTYRALDRWIAALAQWLAEERGVARGDRVAYLGYNSPAMVALVFACARLGAMLVPLNWRLAPAELAFMVADTEPRCLIFSDAFHAVIDQVVPEGAALEAVRLDRLEHLPPARPDAPAGGKISDPLLIIYTSGTTGRPKGAMLDQRAVFYNALMSLDMHGLSGRDRVLVVLPLFHVGGLNITLLPALYAGATVLLHARFEPAATLAAIRTWRPDLLVLVPATIDAVIKLDHWPRADLSSLRLLTTGSSVVPVPLIEAFEVRGIPVVQVYGSTETSPIAVYQRPGEGRTHPTATGHVGLHCEVRLGDAQGGVIDKPGRDGEIEVRGPNVTCGYWRREEETKTAFREGGWFRTGDIGHFDNAGHLYFQDRLKRMIISGGENIYSAEVERVLGTFPGIVESCVVGVPDAHWGEVPVAAVVCAGDAPRDEAAVKAHVARHLARFKVPRRVRFVEALPRNAMGKVVAEDVRQNFENEGADP